MAAPTKYTRQNDYQAATLADLRSYLNPELDANEVSIGEIVDALADIRRDDGKLKNLSVHPDALDTATKLLLDSSWTPKGLWATSTVYEVGDLVEQNNEAYVAAEDHTSGTFSTDHAAGKWIIINNAVADQSEHDSPSGVAKLPTLERMTAATDRAYSRALGSQAEHDSPTGVDKVPTLSRLQAARGRGGPQVPTNADRIAQTVTALRGLDPTNFDSDTTVLMLGYNSPGDGGGGTLYWDASSTETDNGGTIFKPDSLAAADPGRWKRPLSGGINIRWFGAGPSRSASENTTAIQAAIDYAEVLVEAISVNIDIATASVYCPAGQYQHNGLLLSQSVDGVQLFGDGQGVSVLYYAGSSIGLTIGTESGTPNLSHSWLKDITIRGGNPAFTTSDGDIVAGSVGVQCNRMIRNSGMERVQIFGFEKNVQLRDCWTYKFIDCHNHDASVNLIDWQTALNGEIRGGRYDDAGEDLIVFDGQGTSNQIRTLRLTGVTLQESQRSGIRGVDLTQLILDSCYFENNNQSDGEHPDVNLVKGTSARSQGVLTMLNTYHSPGGATWAGTEYAVKAEGFRYINIISPETGSSAYNRFVSVDSDCQHVSILGGVFINMAASSAVQAASSSTSVQEDWVEIDGSDVIQKRVRKSGAITGEVITITGNVSTDASKTFFNVAGNGQTLTLSTADETTDRAIFVRKYSTTGDLTVTSEGSTQISLNGSSNNNAVLSAARGAAWIVFDGTEWVLFPTDEAAGWALSA